MRIPTFPRTSSTTATSDDEKKSVGANAPTIITPPKVATPPRTTAPPAPVGPRPRTSALATFGLVTGVASALLVLSGRLAGYGVGLATLALLISLAGISATGRRHVAGKSDAILGLFLALGAIVLGVLVLTDSLWWIGTDTDTVGRLREWLDNQLPTRI